MQVVMQACLGVPWAGDDFDLLNLCGGVGKWGP